MNGIDPRRPVVVGAGQFLQRPDDPLDALEPLAMMAEVLERAADDAGNRDLLKAADSIQVVRGAWPYPDPGRLLGDRFAADARTGLSASGGNAPQSLVNRACVDVEAGRRDVVLIVGAEGIYTRRRAKRQGKRIPYTTRNGTGPDEQLGEEVPMSHPFEKARGLEMPIQFYPLFESAFRASRGESIPTHRDRVARLWETFNQAAVANPYAWIRTPMTAGEIREPSPGNRMVGFPYTKAMNSNWDLDQAAALVVCSVEAAERHGVPRERWVFPLAGVDGHDTYFVSNRVSLHESPAIRTIGRRLFEMTGHAPESIAHVDLYSCFPSAVQIAATELGLGLDRRLTETGGLTFAGGPLNNYVTHAIATMVGALRNDPGTVGLCSANGGYVTKHAIGLYSTEPAAHGFRHAAPQGEIDALGSRPLAEDHVGRATIEGYTVMYGADGPERALAACLTPDGARTWARSIDPERMGAMVTEEHVGRNVSIGADGELLFP